MPPLRGKQLLERIATQGPGPVYLVYGRERWFADRALELLKEAIFGPPGPAADAARSVNYDAFAGREAKADPLSTATRTLPMFASRRLVVVRNGDRIPAAEWKAFAPYLDDPSPSTTLFLDWSARKPDGRKRWVKSCGKQGIVAELRPLYDREVPEFLRFMSGRVGKQLTHDAASYLASGVGADLHALTDALRRLALFVGDNPTIRAEDVEAAIADTRAHEVWDLTDAVAARDVATALKILGRVRDQGAAAQQLLFHLHRMVRQLWLAHAAVAAGRGRDSLARTLGVPPFVAGKLADAARRFRPADLADALVAIANAEVETRSGGLASAVKDWVVMESLVTSLCGRPRRA